MSSTEDVRTSVLSASTTAEIIGASWHAFECIRRCVNELADRVTDDFPAWVSAAAPACVGRDALGHAPSMPPAASRPGPPPEIAGASEDTVARLVGELAALLHERLEAAARQPAVPGDAAACLRASQAATEIHGLLAGA